MASLEVMPSRGEPLYTVSVPVRLSCSPCSFVSLPQTPLTFESTVYRTACTGAVSAWRLAPFALDDGARTREEYSQAHDPVDPWRIRPASSLECFYRGRAPRRTLAGS